jgi:hypothetical protein
MTTVTYEIDVHLLFRPMPVISAIFHTGSMVDIPQSRLLALGIALRMISSVSMNEAGYLGRSFVSGGRVAQWPWVARSMSMDMIYTISMMDMSWRVLTDTSDWSIGVDNMVYLLILLFLESLSSYCYPRPLLKGGTYHKKDKRNTRAYREFKCTIG